MKRDESVDLLRGIGILFMIMGHVGFGGPFSNWIHAFHMPLFFIITGYFLKPCTNKKELKDTVIKRIKKLLIPYGVFSIVGLLLWIVLKNDSSIWEPIFKILWKNQEGVPVVSAIWFLTCLFFAELIYKAFQVFRINSHLVSLLGIIVGVLIIEKTNIILPLSLLPAMMSLIFIDFGVFLRKLGDSYGIAEKIKNCNFIAICACFVFSVIMTTLNIPVNMRTNIYGNYLLFYVNAIVSTLILWGICIKIDSLVKEKFVVKHIKDMGKYSIIYLCCNQIAIKICEVVFEKWGEVLPLQIFKLILVLGCIHIIIKILKYKPKVGCIFGI